MATPAGNEIFFLPAASAIALAKQADQPTANSCSGLVLIRGEPGVESLTSRRPSELRETPFSRPPLVWVLAVYTSVPIWLMALNSRGAAAAPINVCRHRQQPGQRPAAL